MIYIITIEREHERSEQPKELKMKKKEWKMAVGIGIDLTMELSTYGYYKECLRDYGYAPVEDIIEHLAILIAPILYAKQEAKETPDVYGFSYYDIWIELGKNVAEKYFRDPWGCGVSWMDFDTVVLETIQNLYTN